MRQKITVLACCAAAFIFIVCVTIFGEAQFITQDDLNNIDNRDVMVKVAGIMLKDAGRTADVDAEDIVNIEVMYGDFTGMGQNEAVIHADFGPRYTLISVYREAGNENFEFVGEVGVFTDTQDLRTVHFQNKKRDAIFINEILNEKIGAYEKIEYDKGYMWNDKTEEFVNIYNYPVRIRADWNLSWDSNTEDAPSRWERVTQTTKSLLENGSNPVIRSRYHQEYLVSSDTSATNIPLDNTYTLAKERDVEQSYYWSEEWFAFIIKEMTENATGEKVAVTALWSDRPYVLADFEDNTAPDYNNLVTIKRKNGTTAVVNINSLSPVKTQNGSVNSNA